MKIKKSIDRIRWRFASGKEFKPNENDITAFNEVAEYISRKEKDNIIDNQLFGKLYIYLFGEFVNYYKATAIDTIPQQELHKLLDKNIADIVNEVKDRLNNAELEHAIKANAYDKYKPMEYEEVAENMRIMVSAALNNYK